MSEKPHWMEEHRTICETLEEARKRFKYMHGDEVGANIMEEALNYARAMSLKLTQYRENKILDNKG